MNIIYKYNNENVDFNEVRNILIKAFGGRKIDEKEKIEKAFINSSHVIYVYDDSKLIGFARAISDIEWAIIYNVALDPNYQSKGLGKEILNRLVKSLGNRHIFTYTHPRTISYYEHLGFKRSKMAFKYVKYIEKEIIDKQEKTGFFLPNGYRFENEIKEVIKKEKINNIKKIDYKNDLDDISFDDLNELLEKAFNHNRDINKTIEEFRSSQYFNFAFDGSKLVGCARLITDGVSEALLLNVAVDPDYQGNGIAKRIISNLAEEAKGYDIFIHANPNSYSFYNSSTDFKRYKTAFAYISDTEPDNNDFFIPKGYRYPDEFYNEEIKYYKGKILN